MQNAFSPRVRRLPSSPHAPVWSLYYHAGIATSHENWQPEQLRPCSARQRTASLVVRRICAEFPALPVEQNRARCVIPVLVSTNSLRPPATLVPKTLLLHLEPASVGLPRTLHPCQLHLHAGCRASQSWVAFPEWPGRRQPQKPFTRAPPALSTAYLIVSEDRACLHLPLNEYADERCARARS